jgi:hypothetical protein
VHIAFAAEGDGGVALGIEVDQQGLGARGGDAGGDVDRGRRLADAALLIRDRVDDTHGGAD